VRHVAFAFQHPVHGHEPGAEQLAPLLVHQGGPDDDIHPSGFILEGHEDRSRCGAGPLATGHDAGDFCLTAVRQPHQGFGRNRSSARKTLAQKLERMPAEREAHMRIVIDEGFAFSRWPQPRDFFLRRRSGQQRGPGFDPGYLPVGCVTVTRDRLQRSGLGQCGEIAALERGALRKVGNRCELGVAAYSHDPFSRCLGEPFRHAQA